MLSLPQHIKTLLLGVKLAALLILTACLQVSAKVANAQKLSISFHNGSLEKLFAEIEKKTQYVFFYDATILKGTKPVTVDMKEASVEEILQSSLKGQALDYAIHDRTIFVKKETIKPISTSKGGSDESGPIAVSGIVQSEAGIPLAGATIYIKRLNKSGLTNAAGEFVLKNVPSGEYEVEFTFIGYEPYRMVVNVADHQGAISVRMKQSQNSLDQTVVRGYYTTTNRLNTGNVTTVKADDIAKQPVSNPLAALEGRVPGLVITQTTGAPGGGFTVQIRGQSSIINGNDPFYVIDGVPYSSQTLGLINSTLKNGNPLNFINIADIESIEVLKDADATSIYGSRAANGAILITTKKGKIGKTRFDINACTGYGEVTRNLELMDTKQYLEMRHEAFFNDGVTPTISNAPDLVFWDTTRYTNWQKVFLGNTAHYDDAQASVTGGTGNTQYLFGGGYHRETAVFPVVLPNQGSDQKVSGHVNVTTSSENKRLKVSLNASYVSDVNTVQPFDFQFSSLNIPPDAPPIYNPDGSLNWAPVQAGQRGTWGNPFARLFQTYKGTSSNIVANSVISYSLFRGLDIKTSLGYTNTQTNEVFTSPTTVSDPANHVASGTSSFNATNVHSWIVEPQADYRLNLGRGTLSTLVGLTFQQNSTAAQKISASGFLNDALLQNMQSATTLSSTSASALYKYSAGFARLNYNWEDKYILNLTARRDGSSRFGPGNQFNNFGALGAAWIFSNEGFFKRNISFLSFGKLRGSYGTSGNDQIGDYKFLDLYSVTQYPYQAMQGLYPNSLFNPNLAWELDKKLEGGIELGFLKDRILINASYFRNRSNNQLVTTPLSFVTGFNSIPANLPALVQNTGLELLVNTINIKSKNFRWSSSFNISIPRNKLVAFPGLATSTYKNQLVIGKPITAIKVFHLVGVNDTTGLYQFATSKGGPSYYPDFLLDNNYFINTAPKFYGGFQNSFQYKGVALDILVQFVKQTGTNILSNEFAGAQFNEPVALLNRWQKQGDQKRYQQFSQNTSGDPYTQWQFYALSSDFLYTDASFIRLKNLSLSYTIPQALREKWHIQNLRVYIQGQNLLTFTKYLGSDPESQGTGLPPLRVWTAGFQISL